jgi:hypothetical protein
VGRGGVKINVASDTGDIELSKAEATAPEPPSPPKPQQPPMKPGKGRKPGDVEVM